jgi:hypothetical protein
VVCQWVHDYVPLIAPHATELPPEVEIEEPFPVRRDKDADKNAPRDADLLDE